MPAHGTTDPKVVPDEVVDQGLRRSLADNIAGIATWLDARDLHWRGDLTQKRSFRLQLPRLSGPPSLPLPVVRVGLRSDHSSRSPSFSLVVTKTRPRRCGTGEISP